MFFLSGKSLKNLTSIFLPSVIFVSLKTLKGKSKSSHDLLKDDPRLSSVPAVKYVLNTLAYMQCSCLVLTKKTHNSALTGRKARNQEMQLRYGGQNPNIYFHYLCSVFGSDHKFEHVLTREVTSLMVTLKRAMQMKSMTLRAGRR